MLHYIYSRRLGMFALAINGSPRRFGETEHLLNIVLETLRECGWKTLLIQIGGQQLTKCSGCHQCVFKKDMQCRVNKDSFNSIFARMLESDAIVLGSPTFFSDVTVEMRALLDRSATVALANNHALMAKIGAAVVPVRAGRTSYAYAFDTINHMFQMSSMVLPGSLYRNMGLWYDKTDSHKSFEVERDMRQLGEAIDWLGKMVRNHPEPYPMTHLTP